jgi:hypothetical protein
MNRALSSLYDLPYWRLVHVYHHFSRHLPGNPDMQISHTFHLQLNKLRFGYWCFGNLKQNREKSYKFCWEHATETSLLIREKWIIDPLAGRYIYFSMSSVGTCRPSTSTYKHQVKIRSRACIHALSYALQHRTLPPNQGGLWGCYMFSGSGSHLSNRKCFGATTCTAAPDPVFLQGRASVCHVSYSSGSCLLARQSSVASCVLQLQILPPCKGGLRCTTCPAAPDPASLHGRAPVHHVSYSSKSRLPAW